MKLRIKGNSIRLRLLRSEVVRFTAEGRISEETVFGENSIRYSLIMSKDAESISARFENDEIAIVIPERAARDWTSTETVGLETEQFGSDVQSLRIVVEKDFECLDRPDDPDRADAYPNPNAVC
jgi:hypothetical protein